MDRAEEVQRGCNIPDLVVASHGEDCPEPEDCFDCQCDTEFSHARCELCGGLAGRRTTVARIFPGTTEEPLYYAACDDCVIHIANGELPED